MRAFAPRERAIARPVREPGAYSELTHRRPPHWSGISLVTERPCRQQMDNPFGVVDHGAVHPAHCAERAMWYGRLECQASSFQL